MSRRKFVALTTASLAGLAVAGGGYSLLEAGWVRIERRSLKIPRLPPAFAGTTVAFLADIHHGPYTSLDYVNRIVALANALEPDLVLLGGDYVHQDGKYIAPCMAELAALRAPLGVFAVQGNHDTWEGRQPTSDGLGAARISELTNRGVWLERNGARVRLGGVGDLWTHTQDLDAALGDAKESDACLLLSHNPDFTEDLTDPRVSMVFSGHTHGGQVVFPFMGAPIVPSKYGQNYLNGLCQGPLAQVFVSRGLGTITPPVRFCCRPEINLLTIA